jgi:formamidopyrimidine-DNA glycosylase
MAPMPELPEVEIARRQLERWFKGHRLVRLEADGKARTFRGADVKAVEKTHGTLERITRKGKYLMLAFSDGSGLVAHLGMTGKFVRRPPGVEEKYSRARFVLDSKEVIHFRDPRLFGRMEPAPAGALSKVKAIAALGVDPLADGLDWKTLKAEVGPSRQELKVALMDQGRIAGLGNIHAAEALFRAKLDPRRKPQTLSDAEWKALTQGIHAAIDFAFQEQDGDEVQYLEESGTENVFLVYGRSGTPCTRCGATVKDLTQGGRTTHFCPKCQH